MKDERLDWLAITYEIKKVNKKIPTDTYRYTTIHKVKDPSSCLIRPIAPNVKSYINLR